MDFGRSEVALFRRELFADLRRKRKFALRLGHVSRDSDWSISPRLTRQILKIGGLVESLHRRVQETEAGSASGEQLQCELREIVTAWRVISEGDVILGLRQKGVDMRIGLDIASMTLKRQVDTVVLVTGDSDFVPAAKLARREGVEFLLDPLWQRVSDDLTEHVDGVVSVFPRPVREGALLAA
jgi:uncharacterized LabA/DUF88 family protein